MTGNRVRVLAAVLLAGGLVGASSPGPSSTLALLSDTASVTGGAQAAVLALGVRVTGADGGPATSLDLGDGAVGHLEVTVTGDLPWSLSVQLLTAAGGTDCGSPAAVTVTTAPPTQTYPVACEDAQVLGDGESSSVRRLDVQVTEGEAGAPFEGLLRVRVAQRPGGFSDEVDIPVRTGGQEETPAAVPPASDDQPSGTQGRGDGTATPAAPAAGDGTGSQGSPAGPGPVVPADPVSPPTDGEQQDGAGTPPAADAGPDDPSPAAAEDPSATQETVPDPAG